MILPKVSMMACTTVDGSYCFMDNTGKYQNIVDHPAISKSTRDLDRALFRRFLESNENSYIVCGPTVKHDLDHLNIKYGMSVIISDSIDHVIEKAINYNRNIVVLGGRRTYMQWLSSGLVDDVYIHQLTNFFGTDTPTKKIDVIFGENSKAVKYSESQLLRWNRG